MEIFLCILWYFIGLIILGVFFYKTESCVTLLELIGIVIGSILGPITLLLPIVYFLDNYGNKLLFRWRN